MGSLPNWSGSGRSHGRYLHRLMPSSSAQNLRFSDSRAWSRTLHRLFQRFRGTSMLSTRGGNKDLRLVRELFRYSGSQSTYFQMLMQTQSPALPKVMRKTYPSTSINRTLTVIWPSASTPKRTVRLSSLMSPCFKPVGGSRNQSEDLLDMVQPRTVVGHIPTAHMNDLGLPPDMPLHRFVCSAFFCSLLSSASR